MCKHTCKCLIGPSMLASDLSCMADEAKKVSPGRPCHVYAANWRFTRLGGPVCMLMYVHHHAVRLSRAGRTISTWT